MAAYEYVALDAKGRRKQGVQEADSARLVRQILREQKHAARSHGKQREGPS